MTISPTEASEPQLAPSKSEPDDERRPSASSSLETAEQHPDSIGQYFGRFGSMLLMSHLPITDLDGLRNALVAIFREDTRVASVSVDPLRVPWSEKLRVFPPDQDVDTDDLFVGADSGINPRFADPIFLHIHVPIKNQPLFQGEDDVPTNDYWAAWDGTTLLVLWEREKGVFLPPRSGGQIVIQVLADAALAAGMELIIQACSPGCTNLFAHRVLRITQYPGNDEVHYQPRGFPVVMTHVHVDGGVEAVVRRVFEDLASTAGEFAEYKNVGRRILNIEQRSRALVGELLVLDYEEASAQKRNILVRIGHGVAQGLKSLGGRSRRQRMRELIASLWVAMGAIETYRRDWNANKAAFLDYGARNGRKKIYAPDREEDEAAMKLLDLSFIRAAVEQKSSRFDARVLVLATISGAIVGVIGVIVVSLFG